MQGSGFTAFLSSPGVELLGLVLLTSLGALAHPKMVHKFYAMKDESVVRQAIVISTFFAFLMTFGAYFTGSLSHLFPQVAPLAAAGNFDAIMPTVIDVALPSTLVVIVLLLVLSASMSTLASLVMVSASVVSVDFVRDELKPDMSKKSVVTLMRVLVVVFILLSVLLAQAKIAIIITMMAISWGVISGAFLGPYIWGLFWRRVGKASAWAGFVVGVGFTLLVGWHYHWNAAYMPVISSIAMLGSLAVVPLVALLHQAGLRRVHRPAPSATGRRRRRRSGDAGARAGARARGRLGLRARPVAGPPVVSGLVAAGGARRGQPARRRAARQRPRTAVRAAPAAGTVTA